MAKGGEAAVRVPRSGKSSVTTKLKEMGNYPKGPNYKRAGANVKGTTLKRGGSAKGNR